MKSNLKQRWMLSNLISCGVTVHPDCTRYIPVQQAKVFTAIFFQNGRKHRVCHPQEVLSWLEVEYFSRDRRCRNTKCVVSPLSSSEGAPPSRRRCDRKYRSLRHTRRKYMAGVKPEYWTKLALGANKAKEGAAQKACGDIAEKMRDC